MFHKITQTQKDKYYMISFIFRVQENKLTEVGSTGVLGGGFETHQGKNGHFFLKRVILSFYWKGRYTGIEGEIERKIFHLLAHSWEFYLFICVFIGGTVTPQVLATARTRTGQSQEPGTKSRSPM